MKIKNRISFLIILFIGNIISMEVERENQPVITRSKTSRNTLTDQSAQPTNNPFDIQESGYTYFSTNIDPLKDPENFKKTYKDYIFSNFRNKNQPAAKKLKEEDKKPKVWSGNQVSGDASRLKVEFAKKKLMLEELLKQIAIVMNVMFVKGPQEFQVQGRKYTLKDFYYTAGLEAYLLREYNQLKYFVDKLEHFVGLDNKISKKLKLAEKFNSIGNKINSEHQTLKELTQGPPLKDTDGPFTYNKEFLDKEKNVLELLLDELLNLITSSDLKCILLAQIVDKESNCYQLFEGDKREKYQYKDNKEKFLYGLFYYSRELIDILQKLSASYAIDDVKFYTNYKDLSTLYNKGFLFLNKTLDKIIVISGTPAQLEKKALKVLLDLYNKVFTKALALYKSDYEDNKILLNAISTIGPFNFDILNADIQTYLSYLNSLEIYDLYNAIDLYIQNSGSKKLLDFWMKERDKNLSFYKLASDLWEDLKSKLVLSQYNKYAQYVSNLESEIDKPYVWYSTSQKRAKELLQKLIDRNAYMIAGYKKFLGEKTNRQHTNFDAPPKEISKNQSREKSFEKSLKDLKYKAINLYFKLKGQPEKYKEDAGGQWYKTEDFIDGVAFRKFN